MIIKSVLGDQINWTEVKTFLDTTKDWTATCKLCGKELSGTLTELKAHKCEVSNG